MKENNGFIDIMYDRTYATVEYKGLLNVDDVVWGTDINQYKIYNIEFNITKDEYTGKVNTNLRYSAFITGEKNDICKPPYLIFSDKEINKSVFLTKKDMLLALFDDCLEEKTELVVK